MASRPNIVFVVIDALRADRLGVYGGPTENSPAIDAIAREGATVERAIAQAPWTQPSVASLLSSVYPSVHGVDDFHWAMEATFGDEPKVAVLDEIFPTLPEVLRANGYRTAGFVANPFLDAAFGFARGFDHFDASFAAIAAPGIDVNTAARAWLDRRDRAAPAFLYLHYMDVHGPYDAPAEILEPLLDAVERAEPTERLSRSAERRLGYLHTFPAVMPRPDRHTKLSRYREYWIARYDAGVREMDGHLAALRAALEAAGVWRDALVIVTSDHGEALFEHGFWDHGHSLYDAELHVPLIVRWPGVIPAGRRVQATVQLIDVMPTILDQLRIPAPEGLQGRSIARDLTDGAASEPALAIAEALKGQPEARAIYAGGWKLIEEADARSTMYDLVVDPRERRDVGGAHGEEAARLRRILAAHAARAAARAAGRRVTRVTPSPDQAERLRALGYLGDRPPEDSRALPR